VTDSLEITVIGAGLIGLCTADALALRGARVTVLDARPGPCEGTSFSNSGMIHPSQALSWDLSGQPTELDLNAARATIALGVHSKALLSEKIKALNLPVRAEGCLQIHPDLETARGVQALQSSLGIQTDVIIDPIDTFGLPACKFPDDTSGDARAFGCALAEDLAARGVSFIYGATDFQFRKQSDGFDLAHAGKRWRADHMIVAAGAGSVDVLARAGLRLQLIPIRGAAADFALPAETDDLPKCPVMDALSRSALTVFSDRVRISGGWDVSDPTSLMDRWREIAPGLMLRLGTPQSTWSGVRPVSPAGRPYISGTSLAGLWINTGHGHMGWTLCAGSGELLAEMILEGREDTRFSFAG